MKYPLMTMMLDQNENELLTQIAEVQGIGKTTAAKNMLFEDLFESYYKKVWDEAFNEYASNQSATLLDEGIDKVFLSDLAKMQFDDESEDFQMLFTGWMKKQRETQLSPYFQGKRITKKKSQWIYMFGEVHVMAHIESSSIVILCFDKKSNEEIMHGILDEKSIQLNDGATQLRNNLSENFI